MHTLHTPKKSCRARNQLNPSGTGIVQLHSLTKQKCSNFTRVKQKDNVQIIAVGLKTDNV